MANTPSDILGKVGNLPQQITDVTDSICKGASKVDTMVSKMDAAVNNATTHNSISSAIKDGLSNVTGALKTGTQKANDLASDIRSLGTKASSAITPIATAANKIQASLEDLKNCQQVFATSSLLVNAIVGSVSGHLHSRNNEKLFSAFDSQWDSWAKGINKIYEELSPSGQANILGELAKCTFGDNVYALGSAVKNEAAGIFGGIADFEDAVHAFRGNYRNPIEAAKKIERGVKSIVSATERVANSINGMIEKYQSEMNMTPTGSKVLDYLGNLHNTRAVAAINKTLMLGGGLATLVTDVQGLQGVLKSKNPKAIVAAGKKTVNDAKKIIKELKKPQAASKTVSSASNTPLENDNAKSGSNLQGQQQQSQQSQQDQQSQNQSQQQDQRQAQQQNQSQQKNKANDIGSANADSYVCSGATMKCTFGDRQAKLTVYPDRTVFLTGQPMANVSDHTPLYNIAPFGKCHTTSFPPTGAATAAAHGKLTPMPCVPGTNSNWMNGKNDYIIKGDSALLKSSFCRCCYGGVITITDDGQRDIGSADLSRYTKEEFFKNQEVKDFSRRGFISEEIKKMQEYRAKGFGVSESYMKAIQDIKFEKSRNAERYMSDEDADLKKSNPNYGKNENYGVNCATTTTTFMLRKQGYNVTARARNANKHTDSIAYGLNLYKMWKNQDGSSVTPIMLSDVFMAKVKEKGLEEELTKLEEFKTKLIKIGKILTNPKISDTEKRYLATEKARLKSLYAIQRQSFATIYKEVLLESCKEEGYYTFGLVWETVNYGGGHYTVLKSEKDAEGKTVLSNIEPQTGEPFENIDVMIEYLDYPPDAYDTVMRTDDKVFNKEYNDLFDIKL